MGVVVPLRRFRLPAPAPATQMFRCSCGAASFMCAATSPVFMIAPCCGDVLGVPADG